MADPPLPTIKVTDAQLHEGSGTATNSPSTGTDGGTSARPTSTTSSEGILQANGKKSPIKLIRNNTTLKESNNGTKPTPPALRPSTAIDPLSHHILKRTNTENTIPQKLRTSTGPDSPNAELGSPTSPDLPQGKQLTPEIGRSDSFPAKEKKKGVSFLSRFAIIGGKKKDQSDVDDNESELGDQRTEGMNAHVFSSSIGANGYIPQHKEPPRYIKVRAHHKKDREFDRMFLAQELSGTKHESGDEKTPGLTTIEVETHSTHSRKLSKPPPNTHGAVWATEFSKDGRFMAAAGRDQVVRVWAVISNPDERAAHEHEEDVSSSTSGGERLSAPVFKTKPIREFEGHTGDILDLSWSKNNFLLSSSMDKTVRLWHVSRQECLCTFKHKDFVTSIAFHPRDDRFFLAGSLDSILRLWSIPDKSVAFWNQLPDLITAVAFSPDGKTAIAGVLSGLCLFYDTEGLKYHTQIHVRSSRGKNAKGSKITGIRTTTYPPDDPDGEVKVLVTSNDSRVRLYNLKDKSLEMKFRGHENTCSQINASFSDDARYVICGSEDRKAYIWNTGPQESDKDKRPLELFEAHSEMVTTAVIAPTKTRQLLNDSGDPIYDLCNPPPVTLLSREESRGESAASSVIHNESEKRNSDPASISTKTPAYLARSEHNDGLIIVTADYLGNIKVYRCDCAHKRRVDLWETSSFSSKKILRSASIMTRNSGGSHSRRGSVSQASVTGLGIQSDHILSWRNGITDDGSIRRGSDRSMSPAKLHRGSQSTTNSSHNLASQARQQPYASTPILTQPASNASTTSPPPSIHKTTTRGSNLVPSQSPTPSFTYAAADDNPLKLDTVGKSNQFWNLSSWRQLGATRDPAKLDATSLMPPIQRGSSVVSKLSSEEEESAEDDESESEALTCRKCGGKDFRARKSPGRGLLMVCTRCGSTVE